jgi:anti-sigma B factor antagonist
MEMQSRIVGDVEVLAIKGRFDNTTAPAVAEWLEKTIGHPRIRVVVNLAGTNFVDSTALATLVQGLKRCRQQSGDLHLCSMQRPVYMIFELTRLDKAFNIFVDEAHAIQAFAS